MTIHRLPAVVAPAVLVVPERLALTYSVRRHWGARLSLVDRPYRDVLTGVLAAGGDPLALELAGAGLVGRYGNY